MKGLTMMYKDDNSMARDGCSERLLSMMLDGKGNFARAESPKPSCQGGTADSQSKWGLEDFPLATVYSPLQKFEGLYDLDTALDRGTLFSALDLPFGGRTIGKGGSCNA